MRSTVPALNESFVTLTGTDRLRALHYPRSLFEQIRVTALEKFLSIPRGGLEIGGVLFGKREPAEWRIVAHRPIAIEYRTGPSFTLSEADEEALATLLAAAPADPELAGLQAAGWYHTHTRSDLTLSIEDAHVHRRFFPHDDQIAIVLKPSKFEPVQGAVYTSANLALPCLLFDLDRPGLAAAEPAVIEERRNETSPAPVNLSTIERPASPLVPARFSTKLLAAGVLAAGLVLAALLLSFPNSSAVKAPQPVAQAPDVKPELRLSGAGNQLSIEWNGEAPWVEQATAAELRIRDGDAAPTIVPVDLDFLRRGRIAYVRASTVVNVQLIIRRHTGVPVETVARFIGAPLAVAPATLKAVEAKPPVPEQERARERPRMLIVPKETGSALPPAAALEPPPSMNANVLQQAQLPFAAPKPAPAPAAPVASTKMQAPQSGRAIWTGSLPPGGHLLLESQRVSSGSISGRLPQRPARMWVYPADLASSGIMVYTENKSSTVEPPSAVNGWNLTTYKQDSKRSRGLTVLEHPNPQNSYKKLLVRAEGRPITMLVIQWEEI